LGNNLFSLFAKYYPGYQIMKDSMGGGGREIRKAYKFMAGKPQGKTALELGADERAILKWILK
jgi:hypothetical protein